MIRLLGNYLVKRKNPDNNENVTRKIYGTLCSVVGILLNVLLFVGKYIAGLLSGSVAITADAFNNLSDAVSSAVGFAGVKLSQKPADEDHPFGHGRIEYLITLLVAVLVILVEYSFLTESIDNIKNKSYIIQHYFSLL